MHIKASPTFVEVMSSRTSSLASRVTSSQDSTVSTASTYVDTLKADATDLVRIWQYGEKQWRSYVAEAASSSIEELDPYSLLGCVPPLPSPLPLKSLKGQSQWRVPSPELIGDEGWDPEVVHGPRRTVSLSRPSPVRLNLSQPSNQRPFDITALLVPLWSYIFMVRFLELQRRPIYYSSLLAPRILRTTIDPGSKEIAVSLNGASKELIRWLAAVLAPGMGWEIKGPLPPWITYYNTTTRFTLIVDSLHVADESEKPPSSSKATDLLVEFCGLFHVGCRDGHSNSLSDVPQVVSSFLAALLLPSTLDMGFKPELPSPTFEGSEHPCTVGSTKYIYDYVKDLPYFMTIGIDGWFTGSIIWSIFWEPGLDCNLVGAYFSSILHVLEPILTGDDTMIVSKIFRKRRRVPSLLWHGFACLGDRSLLQKIKNYLQTHDEQPGGSWSRPSIDVAAWTGCEQSFLDENYTEVVDDAPYIQRSDLIRCRVDYQLALADSLRYGWRPMGSIPKGDVELELWQRLEFRKRRTYVKWIWWMPANDKGSKGQFRRLEHRGFSSEGFGTRKTVLVCDVPDMLNFHLNIKGLQDLAEVVTFSLFSFGARDATGDSYLEAMGDGVRSHPWFKDSRGI